MGGFLFIIIIPGMILSITMSILLLCWQKTSSSYAIMQLLLLLLYLKKALVHIEGTDVTEEKSGFP